jgi:carbon-monoxide dehydrogenase small subunit
MTEAIVLQVNGRVYPLEVEPDEALLHTLRLRLGLTGTKDGCSEGECGACTVLLDGRPVDACLFPTCAAEGSSVETIEGIEGAAGGMSRIQEALVRTGGVQCGFCTPGFVMTLTALLRADPDPGPEAIRDALAGNICRCTGYVQIVDAALGAVEHTEKA